MSHVDPFGLADTPSPPPPPPEPPLPDVPPYPDVLSGEVPDDWTAPSQNGPIGKMFRARFAPAPDPGWGEGMFWDMPPEPVYVYGTVGNNATSAGGLPTVTSSTQAMPTSRSDYLARQHPALAPRIRGAEREKWVPVVASVVLSVLTASPHLGAGAVEAEVGEGSFSIIDWSGYPEGMPRPTGPVRVIGGEEYVAARAAADRTNAAIRAAYDLDGTGLQIHEIQPVKFGGSPVDPANKMLLPAAEHIGPNGVHPKFWTPLQRWATQGGS